MCQEYVTCARASDVRGLFQTWPRCNVWASRGGVVGPANNFTLEPVAEIATYRLRRRLSLGVTEHVPLSRQNNCILVRRRTAAELRSCSGLPLRATSGSSFWRRNGESTVSVPATLGSKATTCTWRPLQSSSLDTRLIRVQELRLTACFNTVYG